MTASRPALQVVEGRFIRLEPLTTDLLPELHGVIAHPEVFAGGYGGGPRALHASLDGFVSWATQSFPWDTRNLYLLRVNGGHLDGRAVGMSTLGDFDLEREHAHIGWTAYDPRVWGSPVNAEAKLLLLGMAFESGFGRVKIITDVLNERSRSAILRLGASFEGIVRRDELRADGTWRDTAVYSVLIDEWPDVRARLQERLAGYGDTPVHYR